MTDTTVTPPVVNGFDAATLLAAVASEGWPVDLSGAVLRSDGWENAVIETADGWILRFPRVADLPFEREVAILDRLAGRLPVPIPAIAFTGTRTRFAAYRKLTGTAFDREAYLAVPAARRAPADPRHGAQRAGRAARPAPPPGGVTGRTVRPLLGGRAGRRSAGGTA
jgi:Phosphotransferase enzyme family